MHYPSALEQLDSLYPGVCLLTLKQVAKVLNRAEQTIRHQRHAKKFPIPDAPASRPRRPLFRKVDVAAFIDSGAVTTATKSAPTEQDAAVNAGKRVVTAPATTSAPTSPANHPRGAPKKTERHAASQLGITVKELRARKIRGKQ